MVRVVEDSKVTLYRIAQNLAVENFGGLAPKMYLAEKNIGRLSTTMIED